VPIPGVRRKFYFSVECVTSADMTANSRHSFSVEDPHSMMTTMQNSMWGDMMSDAMKEEDDL
jgi:hypothetical protein